MWSAESDIAPRCSASLCTKSKPLRTKCPHRATQSEQCVKLCSSDFVFYQLLWRWNVQAENGSSWPRVCYIYSSSQGHCSLNFIASVGKFVFKPVKTINSVAKQRKCFFPLHKTVVWAQEASLCFNDQLIVLLSPSLCHILLLSSHQKSNEGDMY